MDLKRPQLQTLSKPDSSDGPFERLSARGRNARGVPIYKGCPTFPTEVAIHRRLHSGLKVCAFGIGSVTYSAIDGSTVFGDVAGIVGSSCLVSGVIRIYTAYCGNSKRKALGSLIRIDEASAQLRVPELTLLLSIRENGREPKCIVDGREFFRPEDFGDAMVLLRPAEIMPTDSDHLLRVAGHIESDLDTLVRPAIRSPFVE